MIDRNDMLELTRRMTDARTHLARLAGGYLDEEGYVDGTFNTNFLKLRGEERKHALEIARAIPFSRTNEELLSFRIPGMRPGSIWQLLYALRDCELKNDALLLTLYEYVGEKLQFGLPFAVYVYYGVYDIPAKSSDKTVLEDGAEVYRYLIAALCPTDRAQNAGMPFAGLLYPALTRRSVDFDHVNVFSENADKKMLESMKRILGL
jgi:hypothetical protein